MCAVNYTPNDNGLKNPKAMKRKRNTPSQNAELSACFGETFWSRQEAQLGLGGPGWLKVHVKHTNKRKIPCELFFNLQGFMWVEFHSKAHGVWWMSWNIIKKRHEKSSKRPWIPTHTGKSAVKLRPSLGVGGGGWGPGRKRFFWRKQILCPGKQSHSDN